MKPIPGQLRAELDSNCSNTTSMRVNVDATNLIPVYHRGTTTVLSKEQQNQQQPLNNQQQPFTSMPQIECKHRPTCSCIYTVHNFLLELNHITWPPSESRFRFGRRRGRFKIDVRNHDETKMTFLSFLKS